MDNPKVGRRSVNVLLLNYTGYPDYTSYFLADSGLAYLAAVLIGSGHRPFIRDFVSLGTAERLFDPETAPTVRHLRAKVREEAIQFRNVTARTLDAAREIDDEVDRRNMRVALEIADEISADVVQRDIDLIGIKLWTQPSLREVAAMLGVIKHRHPQVRIVGGGGHVDYFQQRVLESIPALDAVALADGELALAGYAEYLAGGIADPSSVPNLIYRAGATFVANPVQENPHFTQGRVLPLYDADVYPAMSAPDLKMKTITFEDSRGCQFSCGFCAHPIKSGGLRLRAIDSIVEEIKTQNERHGFINFSGAGSNTPFSHANKLFQAFEQHELGIAVNFFQSLRDFRPKKADAMLRAQIPILWVGVETADQALLADSYDKRRDMQHTKEVCQFLNEHHIGYIMSLIYPSLGENDESTENTVEFVRSVGLGHIVVYPPLLQPRTPWMESPHITWLDRGLFLEVSQLGLEEVENRVLPPMLRSEELNESVLLNGLRYRDIYVQNLAFRARLDSVCGGDRGYQRDIGYTPSLAPFMRQLNSSFATIDKSLQDGEFDLARTQMARFNELATAGSVAGAAELAKGSDTRSPARTPHVMMRTGGPA
jgi:radical SAM superfamily enzyme YgiQ (UPF0313 family)